MSLEQALADNTAALKALHATLAGAAVTIDAPSKPAKVTKAAQTAPTKETSAASPAAASPTDASPSSESQAGQSAAAPALIVNVNHLIHVAHALIKKGKVGDVDHKANCAAVLAEFGAKNVPMIKVTDYPAAYEKLSALLPVGELATVLAAVAAKG